MNKFKEIAEMFGLEAGEVFALDITDDGKKNGRVILFERFKFENKLCYKVGDKWVDNVDKILLDMLLGYYEVIYLPYKPKTNDNYRYVNADGLLIIDEWDGNDVDYYRYNARNCFKLNEQISKETKEKILDEMKGQYNYE